MDFSRIHAESTRTNNLPKVFHRIRVETTLVTIYKEAMFSEVSEYLLNVLLMVSHVVRKDEDVVQINQEVDIQ